MRELGIEPLLDVMHFGTPLWLKQAVGDPEFPEALEHFTDALVSRYRGAIKTWCPFNEPLVSALFSGDFGFWPPHRASGAGTCRCCRRIVQARQPRHPRHPHAPARGDGAARATPPRTTRPARRDLQPKSTRRNLRRFLVMDLLLGRVDRTTRCYAWLTSYGMSELDLEWFRTNPQSARRARAWTTTRTATGSSTASAARVRQHRADNPVGLYGVANAY